MKKKTYKEIPVFKLSDYLKNKSDKLTREVIIFGNFGAMNMGDDAILTGQIDDLNKLSINQISVVSRFPEEIEKTYRVKGISMIDLKLVLKKLLSCDLVIIGGGGLFCKNTRAIKGTLFQLYFTIVFMILPLLMRKEIVLYGVGVYPNMNIFIRRYILFFFRFVKLITVRDEISYKFLKKHLKHIHYYKDNSFLMDLLSKDLILKNDFIRKRYNPRKKNIGIALKRPFFKEKEFMKQLDSFIIQNSKHCDFWFFSLDYHKGYDNDYILNKEIVKRVRKKIDKKCSLFLVPVKYSSRVIFSMFQLMDCIIAMRLHGLIFGYRLNKAIYGISYDKKCSSFLDSCGIKAFEVGDVRHEEITRLLKV